jgi:hypothetical protein
MGIDRAGEGVAFRATRCHQRWHLARTRRHGLLELFISIIAANTPAHLTLTLVAAGGAGMAPSLSCSLVRPQPPRRLRLVITLNHDPMPLPAKQCGELV